jgi:hypothetical protein
MFTYFTLYRGNKFLVNLKDYFEVIGRILGIDMEVFDNTANKLGFKHSIVERVHVPMKTLTREQI